MSSVLIACGNKSGALKHYVPGLRLGGWQGEIALVAPGEAAPDLKKFSGLLLCGGGDIHPNLWDEFEDLHPSAEVDIARDLLEAPLVRGAWDMRMPIFGICRGVQMLNVAMGGSLIQDIPEYFGISREVHSFGSPEDSQPRHEAQVEPRSRLFEILGSEIVFVNSRHHQAVKRLASEFKAAAWHVKTSDPLTGDLIEAIEAADRNRFAMGVQWHPENLVRRGDDAGRAALKLFQAFVGAVMNYKQK